MPETDLAGRDPLRPTRDRLPHATSFALLGGHVLVRTRHADCMAGIEAQFSAARIEPWTTPDHIVECTWREAGRYLFRSRPSPPGGVGPLAGVRVLAFNPDGPLAGGGDATVPEWPFADPPLPAFRLPPFRDRFVGLHAAAVVLPAGGVVIVGARGAGKSTTAIELVNSYGGMLLTDETVFLHRRTAIVEPFACCVGTWEHGRLKHRLPAVEVCARVAVRPTTIDTVLVLRQEGNGVAVQPLDAGDAFQAMLNHHVDVGSDPDEAMTTLAMLARQIPVATVHWGSYADLRAVPGAITAWLGAMR